MEKALGILRNNFSSPSSVRLQRSSFLIFTLRACWGSERWSSQKWKARAQNAPRRSSALFWTQTRLLAIHQNYHLGLRMGLYLQQFLVQISMTWLFFFFNLFTPMEVPRLGVESELQLLAKSHSHSKAKTEQSLLPHTAVHSNAGSLTHWVGSGIELVSSRILVGFVTAEPQQELLSWLLFFAFLCFSRFGDCALFCKFSSVIDSMKTTDCKLDQCFLTLWRELRNSKLFIC